MPLKVSDGIGTWIKDFKKSDAPQFKGKSADERRDMAIAAYLSAKRGGKPQNEGVDEKIVGYKKDPKISNLRVPIKRRQGTILPKKEENEDFENAKAGKRHSEMMANIDRFKTESTSKPLQMYEAQFISPKMYKVKQLARLGLVDKQDVQKLLNAMDTMNQGKELPKKQRDIIFGAFGDLIDLVTGDQMIFQKAKKAVKEDIQEADDKDPGEYDEEGLMMKDQLDIIMDAADEIYDIVEDDENLPEWVQNKITKAADYIDSSRDYLMAKKKDNSDD